MCDELCKSFSFFLYIAVWETLLNNTQFKPIRVAEMPKRRVQPTKVSAPGAVTATAAPRREEAPQVIPELPRAVQGKELLISLLSCPYVVFRLCSPYCCRNVRE